MMAKRNPWGALAAAAGTLLAVGLLVLIMVVVEAHPAEATFPGKPGKIADVSSDGQDTEIYTINVGGGGKVPVTENPFDDYHPSYSPNGKKIAYTGYDGNDFEIYTINAGGGKGVPLTDNTTDDDWPSYSPNGKEIAYQGKDGPNGDTEIYTINAGGGARFNVTDNSRGDSDPSWGSRK
jgi:Tol biopolymer transport system component